MFIFHENNLFLLFNIIDSYWQPWSSWSQCSKSCFPGGVQTRDRACLTFPRLKKENCTGNVMESRQCNMVSCSGNNCLNNLTKEIRCAANFYKFFVF